MYDISIEVTVESPDIDVAAMHALAARVMEGEEVMAGTALAILVTDDDAVRAMNHQFLGIDAPTDVLSFPDEADDFVQGVADEPLLGDIAIAMETAARQAQEGQRTVDAEIAHLLTHGILHLSGYDHEASAEEEQRMQAREEHYLGDLGAFHRHTHD